MTNKNFYITTPIYYPSGNPHMGHAYSSIIADVIARFKKFEGYDVMFLTGTDEHGLKIQREAEKNGYTPKEFCDKLSKNFKDLTKTLYLSNTDFIRTTEKRHKVSVEELWNKLEKSGDIYLSKYSGWYSVSDEAYYDESEIETKDNIKISKNSGSKVEWVEEESYFFRLSKWSKKLLEFYKKNPNFIMPVSRRNEVTSFVKKGLNDLSISRTTFFWGLKVPNNDKHVIYVWLDALTNYLSAINFPNINDKTYKKYWPADIHIIGKDILRFHAIYWPAFLLSAGLKPPKKVFGHGWILSDKKKMSKSLGNILDPIEIIKTYGVDQLRYYLMKEVSHGNDGSISLENLVNCVNNDLANNYGNLCQRVFSFTKKNLKNTIPIYDKFNKDDIILIKKIQSNLKKLKDYIDNQDINNYVKTVVDFSFDSNKYFNDMAPWSLKKDQARMNTVVYTSLLSITYISFLLNPLMPGSTSKILKVLNLDSEKYRLNDLQKVDIINSGSELRNYDILFKKVDYDN